MMFPSLSASNSRELFVGLSCCQTALVLKNLFSIHVSPLVAVVESNNGLSISLSNFLCVTALGFQNHGVPVVSFCLEREREIPERSTSLVVLPII